MAGGCDDCDDVDFFDDIAELMEEQMGEAGGVLQFHQVIIDPETGGTATGGSEINSRWGYVEEPDTPVTPDSEHPITTFTSHPYLLSWAVPNTQHKTLAPGEPQEFSNEYDAVVKIAAGSLTSQGITIHPFNRDNSFFRLEDGRELQIESVLPTPVHSPIMVRFICTNRKPIDE